MSFRILRAAEVFVTSTDPATGAHTFGLRTLQPQPPGLNGPFKLKKAGVSTVGANPLLDNVISAASVSWQPAPLTLRTAYHPGRFYPLKVSFVIATNGTNDA